MTRVKCIRTKAHPSAPTDPFLVKGRFYTVSSLMVLTDCSPDPYIEIIVDGAAIQRPRYMFGPFLTGGTMLTKRTESGRKSVNTADEIAFLQRVANVIQGIAVEQGALATLKEVTDRIVQLQVGGSDVDKR